MPKVIPPEIAYRHELRFSDERWGKITEHLPKTLSDEASACLKRDITGCCCRFIERQRWFSDARANAAVMQKPGGGQLAPFERLAKGLRMAADAWKDVRAIRDDRLDPMAEYDGIEALAVDAEQRLAWLRRLGEPTTVSEPFPSFVRDLALALRKAGLEPTITGRLYEKGKPTWFQKFIPVLNEHLLGHQGKQPGNSLEAFYSEITKALRGDGNPGNPENKSPDRVR